MATGHLQVPGKRFPILKSGRATQVGALFVPADGDGKIGAIQLAGAAPGTLFHVGGNGHIDPLAVELCGKPDGLPRAEMHTDPASLTEFLIYENFTTFHSELLRQPISTLTKVGSIARGQVYFFSILLLSFIILLTDVKCRPRKSPTSRWL
jgi:hypothetical protein